MLSIIGRFKKSTLFGKYRKDEHFCFIWQEPIHVMSSRMSQAVRVKGPKLKKILETPFGNYMIKIKQEFYSGKNVAHKIYKEKNLQEKSS